MPVGRPREFDVDQALERALQVFWRKGYEGTSLPDLTKAMRINRPSLYAAFGNKESLYRRAIERYAQQHACHVEQALAEPTSRAVAARLLYGGIDLVTGPRNPRGCLMVQGALACSETAESARRATAKMRQAGETALRERLERAQAEGDLPANTNPADVARYLTTLSYGLSIQANAGATRKELRQVAELALSIWPDEPG